MATEYGTETDSVYSQAGWGSRLERGNTPALVIIDLHRGFTESQFPAGADLTDVVEANARLLDAAHAAGVPVYLTKIVYQPAETRPGAIAWLAKAQGMRALVAGTELVDMDPRLPVDEDADVVIEKKGASGFYGTTLAGQLRARGVDTIVLTGATTSGCVRASAVDAVQEGFTVLVPQEAVGDRAQGPHDANLFDIDAKYGDVVTLDDALAYLTERTTT
jgi:maleamate amidohydrolase